LSLDDTDDVDGQTWHIDALLDEIEDDGMRNPSTTTIDALTAFVVGFAMGFAFVSVALTFHLLTVFLAVLTVVFAFVVLLTGWD
jgi:hypothetical protein